MGDLLDLVDEIVLAVSEARGVPLSGTVMLDREELLSSLRRLREELPEDLRAARWMVRERETFVARTNEQARQILDRAKARAQEMVSESSIMGEAVEEANALVRRAEAEARRIRLEAEDFSESRLERLEQLFGSLVQQIRQARAELHQARQPGE
ncbi:MAG: hypothetical protein M3N51_05850 [Actinomycetota bacterium]|nr:hypothetical protein [Actinomycetota bacterium]